MTSFASLPVVQHALAGIRIGVCVLIAQAVWKMFKNGVKDFYGLIVFFAILLASYFNVLPVVACVLIAMVCGLAYCQIMKKKNGVSPALAHANQGVPPKKNEKPAEVADETKEGE